LGYVLVLLIVLSAINNYNNNSTRRTATPTILRNSQLREFAATRETTPAAASQYGCISYTYRLIYSLTARQVRWKKLKEHMNCW